MFIKSGKRIKIDPFFYAGNEENEGRMNIFKCIKR